MIFYFRFCFTLFPMMSKGFCDITSSTHVARHDSILKEIFPPGNYKLYFPQKLLKIASEENLHLKMSSVYVVC